MKGLDNITAKIINDAREEADKIFNEAEIQAKEIIKQYESKALSEKDILIKNADRQVKEKIRHSSDMAELDGRKLNLSVKQEVLDLVFNEAFEGLRSMPEEEYISFLSNMAAKASVKGSEAVIMSKKDRDAVGARVIENANTLLLNLNKKAELYLSEEERDIAFGLILKSGDIEVNCTSDVLYRAARSILSSETAALLFD